MPAIALYPTIQSSDLGFASLLHQGGARFDLDLQHATLVEVLEQFDKYHELRGKRKTLSSLIYNIKQIELNYNAVVMPVQVTDLFYAYLVQFMVARGCLPSTITTYCSQLKAALSWASKHNCRVSSTYDEFKAIKFSRTRVALTPDQVSHIYHYDINAIKCRADHRATLCKVRDMFVLSCNLGQRYSDMIRVAPTCFSFDYRRFTIVQQKSGNTAVVDLDSMTIDKYVTREILERYNWCAPYTGDKSNYDHYLHELLRLIGGQFVTTEVVDESKVQGKVVKTTTPLYRKIASHTARRTFVTYHVNRGVHEAKVRRCSGHSDSRSFVKYVIYNEQD